MYCPSPEKSIYRGFTSDGMSKRFNYGGETTWLDKPCSWYLSWVWVLIAASFWSSLLKRPMPLFLFPVGGWVRDSMLPSHCQRLCHVSRHFPRTNQPTPPLPHPKLIHLVWPYLGPSPMKGAKFPGAQPSTKTFPGILQSSAPAKPPSLPCSTSWRGKHMDCYFFCQNWSTELSSHRNCTVPVSLFLLTIKMELKLRKLSFLKEIFFIQIQLLTLSLLTCSDTLITREENHK